MHELAIATDLAEAVAKVAQAHPGRKVQIVHLQVGELRGIVADSMSFCWRAAIKDTPFDEADLLIKSVPAAGQCRECDAEFDVHDLMFVCPVCESGNVETLRGKELILERIQMN